MELINQSKTNFKIGLDKNGKDIFFKINEVKDFDDNLSNILLRYKGINSLESLRSNSDKLFAEGRTESESKKSKKSKESK